MMMVAAAAPGGFQVENALSDPSLPGVGLAANIAPPGVAKPAASVRAGGIYQEISKTELARAGGYAFFADFLPGLAAAGLRSAGTTIPAWSLTAEEDPPAHKASSKTTVESPVGNPGKGSKAADRPASTTTAAPTKSASPAPHAAAAKTHAAAPARAANQNGLAQLKLSPPVRHVLDLARKIDPNKPDDLKALEGALQTEEGFRRPQIDELQEALTKLGPQDVPAVTALAAAIREIDGDQGRDLQNAFIIGVGEVDSTDKITGDLSLRLITAFRQVLGYDPMSAAASKSLAKRIQNEVSNPELAYDRQRAAFLMRIIKSPREVLAGALQQSSSSKGFEGALKHLDPEDAPTAATALANAISRTGNFKGKDTLCRQVIRGLEYHSKGPHSEAISRAIVQIARAMSHGQDSILVGSNTQSAPLRWVSIEN